MAIKSQGNPQSTYNAVWQQTAKGATDKPYVAWQATGGSTVEPGNGYRYHVFTSPGTLTMGVGSAPGTANVLIVGGGGIGGFSADGVSGGGGGGGIVNYTSFPLASPQSVTIGDGQTADGNNTGANQGATAGGDTVFGATTAKGGGAGAEVVGHLPTNANPNWKSSGRDGGSGGGGSGYCGPGCSGGTPGGSALQPTQPLVPGAGGTNYGTAGGLGGGPGTPAGSEGGGGGGGSSAAGTPSQPGPQYSPVTGYGAVGGNGQAFPAFSAPLISPIIPGPAATAIGPNGYFAGGGSGGSTLPAIAPGTGGRGGGGDCGPGAPSDTDATGYGSGGAGSQVGQANTDQSPEGSPGCVIVRYSITTEASETTSATGGTKTTVGDWAYHEFNSPGNFTVTASPGSATLYYLVVGGGGGGGNSGTPAGGGAGGGGAGAFHCNHPSVPAPMRGGSYSYGPGTYAVVVGSGGAAAEGNNANGTQGGTSNFNTGGTGSGANISSAGGGYGAGNMHPFPNGGPGGSGGGGGYNSGNGGSVGPTGGNVGGAACSGAPYGGGGGGGAGAAGHGCSGPDALDNHGGVGVEVTWDETIALSKFYAGGAGGGSFGPPDGGGPADGGNGGGGRGAAGPGGVVATAGTDGTGGGGGGGAYPGLNGKKGGDGVVIVSYNRYD